MNFSFPTLDTGPPDCCPGCGGPILLTPVTTAEQPCPHCRHRLWFLRRCVGDVLVITFLPGLTSRFGSSEQVDEVVLAIGKASRLLLNLGHLHVVSSAFLGMLMELSKRLASSPGLKIFGVEPESLRVFTATKLDELFRIYDDEESALAVRRPMSSDA
jgi:anti-anti-sigma regulatory factor